MYVVSSLAKVPDPFQATDEHDALFSQEYEEQQTPEAKFVKDLDRLELTLQTVEYERGSSFLLSLPPPALPLPSSPHSVQPRFDTALLFLFTRLSLLTAQSQRNLAPFLAGTIPHIRHPAVQSWTKACMDEREAIYAERGEQAVEWEGVNVSGGVPTVGSDVVYERE